MIPEINNTNDLEKLFPADIIQLKVYVQAVIDHAHKNIQNIYTNNLASLDYNSFFGVIDKTQMSFTVAFSALNALLMLSKSKTLRKHVEQELVTLEEQCNKLLTYNNKLYAIATKYIQLKKQQESLSGGQEKFVAETIRNWKLNGLDLSATQLQEFKDIMQELNMHMAQFEHNQLFSKPRVYIDKDKLPGVPDSYLQDLKKAPDGSFDLEADTVILESCELEPTRIKFWKLLVNQAYPENLTQLRQLVKLRDKLARLLGFTSYAQYDLSCQMAKSVDVVEAFLESVIAACQVKLLKEIQVITKKLPASVTLTKDNKIKPWDMWFIKNYYKEHVLKLNEEAISKYFELENTISGLLDFAQQFFNVTLKKQKKYNNLWTEDLIVLKVYKHKKIYGYIILDLFERKDKYQNILEQPVIPTYINLHDKIMPGVTVITANFLAPTKSEPSLLRFSEVMVFLHEFGHALHTLLGAQHIISFAGSQVTRDFVEMPSQMLEQWLWNPDMLRNLSCHYKTGKKMPESFIKKIIKLKNFDSADLLLEQCFYAMFSLELYREGAQKDIPALHKRLFKAIRPHIAFSDDDHSYATFDHLLGYGAKYYCYLWSRVFALDLLKKIQKFGRTHEKLQAIGKKYVKEIISPGGSIEPMLLLKKFLGRAPSLDTFFEAI